MSYKCDLLDIIEAFDHRMCLDCGKGLDMHIIAPNALGKPILFCFAMRENTE